MTKMALNIIVFVILGICLSQNSLSAERADLFNAPPPVPALEPIAKEDKILIIAPHPDDEALGLGGVIQKALKAGAEVRIVYLTHGDHNQLAFIVYEKRIVIKKQAILGMGEIRRKEAMAAMKSLGVPESNLIFLGYPDFGTYQIFLRYWGEVAPFQNMLTKTSYVPYKDALTPNALYKGESILWDVESVLRKYQPTKIFSTNPIDTNPDHKAAYLFLQVALLNLKGKIPEPKLCPYAIHCYGWPAPRNYHPELYLNVPPLLDKGQLTWKSSELSEEEVAKKYDAICLYKTQCADSAFYLKAFARKNELFCDYPVIDLSGPKDKGEFEKIASFKNKVVVYGKLGDKLLINVFFKRGSDTHSFYMYLMGYDPKVEFGHMPKIKLNINAEAFRAMDRGKFIRVEGLKVSQKQHSVAITIPLKALGNPTHILASANTYSANFSTDFTAWRLIKVE